jgi:hypothetical protein
MELLLVLCKVLVKLPQIELGQILLPPACRCIPSVLPSHIERDTCGSQPDKGRHEQPKEKLSGPMPEWPLCL